MNLWFYLQLGLDAILLGMVIYLLKSHGAEKREAETDGAQDYSQLKNQVEELRRGLMEVIESVSGLLERQVEHEEQTKQLAQAVRTKSRESLPAKAESLSLPAASEENEPSAEEPISLTQNNFPSLKLPGNDNQTSILELHGEGWSVERIARHLKMGQGEVNLTIDLKK